MLNKKSNVELHGLSGKGLSTFLDTNSSSISDSHKESRKMDAGFKTAPEPSSAAKRWNSLSSPKSYSNVPDSVNFEEALKIQKALRWPHLNWHFRDFANIVGSPSSAAMGVKFTENIITRTKNFLISSYDKISGAPLTSHEIDLLTETEISSFLIDALHDSLAVVADNCEADGVLAPLIGGEGGFELEVSITILKIIEVKMSDQNEFIKDLYWSVWAYVSKGGSIAGDWGHLVAQETRLYMKLSELTSSQYVDDGTVVLAYDF